ncbi:MAG: response regulator transcription factor [Anaerolineae bacterium]|nr:response regulator transcription factor [Anaerolineae bacterium]
MRVLVVDDDLVLADVVSFTLRRAGYEVLMAHDGQEALDRWASDSPDLVILDLNLPRLDGLSVCQRIRALADTPIIILSVRDEEDDVVRGLQLGADDYVVKPFSPRQLVARAEALLRRVGTSPVTTTPLTVGDLSLDLSRNEVYCQDKLLTRLTRLEVRLLDTLMRSGGQVVPTEMLIDQIWGTGKGDQTMLKQVVYRLRRKLEPGPDSPSRIETVVGSGYALIPHPPAQLQPPG